MKRYIFVILASIFFCLAESSAQDGWYWCNLHRVYEYLNSVSFTDANTGTAVGEHRTILRTTDGGETWTSQTNPFSGTGQFFRSVSFTDANHGTVVGANGVILHTTDGGTNWATQTSGTTKSLHAVFFTDANTGTIVGANGIILRTVDVWRTTDVKSDRPEIPSCFALEQNYPNPFNPSTTIRYQLSVASQVSMKIYDIIGREVITLVDETRPAGFYHVVWNAAGLPGGVY
jgi:hypothetical protein